MLLTHPSIVDITLILIAKKEITTTQNNYMGGIEPGTPTKG